MERRALDAIAAVKCAAAFVRDFLFDLPVHARGIFTLQVFLAIGAVTLDLFRGGNSKVKNGWFHPYGFAGRGWYSVYNLHNEGYGEEDAPPA